jgi:hypothetical protein
MKSSSRALLFLLAPILLLPAIAQAKPKAAITSFRALGDLSDSLKADLRTSLAGGLVASGLELVPDTDAQKRLAGKPELAGCQTPVCSKKIGELLGVPYLIQATDERVGAARYESSIDAIAAADGHTLVHVQSVCAVCTGKEAGDDLSLAAASLTTKLEQVIAPPVVPKAALAPAPSAPAHPERGRLLRHLAIGAWVVAGASLVSGIALTAVDGHATGSTSVDPTSGRIEVERLSTLAGGVSLIVLAPVLATAGGVMWWRAKVSGRPITVSLAPGPGALGLSTTARW